MIERVLIIKHCAHKDMYDDGGYCEHKIKKYEPIYWAEAKDCNGELMCSECMLQHLLYQLKKGGGFPVYEDRWGEEFETAKIFNKTGVYRNGHRIG